MNHTNILFITLWMVRSFTFSYTWPIENNGIFSVREIRNLTKIGDELELLDTIANGAQLAIGECNAAFNWERWNCPEIDFNRKQKQSATREQAVVQSIISAGVTYSIAQNCSKGLLPGCGCSPAPEVFSSDGIYTKEEVQIAYRQAQLKMKLNNDSDDYKPEKRECITDVDYAENISKNFLDRQVIGNDVQAQIHLHNNAIGRRLVKTTMVTKCRCHGLSGSCSVQTCWKELAPFADIAKIIRKRYRDAERIVLSNKPADRSFEKQIEEIEFQVKLVFLEESHDYCIPDENLAWPGTRGRACSRDKAETTSPEERNSCKTLCRHCGLKVHKVKKKVAKRCNCSFKWCCSVECDICYEMVDEFYCV